MTKISIIPARPKVGNNIKTPEKPKLRVAAYCRVSTDSDEQATSYEVQVEHYTKQINANTEWEIAGIYADDGISGTNTKKREEFNKMIEDCERGNIDMIITKSISRFARNTLDCLKYVRLLKDKNIPIYFEKENINSMDAKGEVLLTIMASLAQQESQSLSQNVKLGIQYRFQEGKVMVNTSRFLGYTKDKNKNLIIDPKQAEIVKRIYREYLEGSSMDKIANSLMADGVLTGAGKEKWHTSTINKILRNEKYIGDALLQKTYTTDFLTKTRIKNNGTVPQYYVEDSHPAIIPKDIYLMVQEELVKRRVVHTSSNGKKRNFSSNHCFSQIVFCGGCGEIFRRIHWNNRGKKSIVWRCLSRLEITGIKEPCNARTVNELLLEEISLKAINQILVDKDDFIKTLQENIISVIRLSNVSSIEGIEKKLDILQQKLLDKTYNKKAYDEIADDIFRLRELKAQSQNNAIVRNDKIKRINDLKHFINQQSADITVFDEKLVRRLVDKITVFEGRFVIEFKSGVVVKIDG